MNDSLARELLHKMDILIRLTAIGYFEEKTQREKIHLLSMAGLQPKEIADILGTTSNTVSVSLSNMRKERKSGTGGKKRKEEVSGNE
jgi:DNA-binding NarL/FixJ family response regulator